MVNDKKEKKIYFCSIQKTKVLSRTYPPHPIQGYAVKTHCKLFVGKQL